MSHSRTASINSGAPARWGPRISRRILAAWLPWWPTERLARHRPEARTHPFVTVAESRNRLIIDAANPPATRAGLDHGMSLADARAVVPDVVVRPADPAGDALALEQLARWADRFTPRVMPDARATLFLDIAGCTRLFGGEEALTASLRAALEDFGLTVRLALADTPGAAWALAHYGVEDPAVAPAGAGPSGLKDALAELPVAALRLSADVAAGLASFGLDKISALFAIKPVELVRRFGMEPVRRLEEAMGIIDEPIKSLRPPSPREAQRAFAEPISRPADLRAALDGLLDELCLELGRSGKGARRLHLTCNRVDGGRRTVTVGTSRPLRRKKPLMGLFAEKLDQLEPGFGIDEIVLVADAVETVDELQIDCSGETAGRYRAADEEELADLLDRLGNRFGFGRIGCPMPRQSWLPERAAFRELNPDIRQGLSSGPQSGSAGQPGPAANWPEDRRRPLRLLSYPEPVDVVTAETEEPPPATPGDEASDRTGSDGDSRRGLRAFRRRGRLHQLRAAEGPERLECEWWREDALCRDYYLVEDKAGRRYWLFREVERDTEGTMHPEGRPRWFLHGLFA